MKSYLFILIIFCSNLSEGQDVTYTYSDNIPLREEDYYEGLLHSDASGFTIEIYENNNGLLTSRRRKLILEKYDQNFNQVFSYEYGDKKDTSIDIIGLGKTFIWITMRKTNSSLYEFSMTPISKDGKKGKKQFLFKTRVDKSNDLPICYLRKCEHTDKAAFVAIFDKNSKKEPAELFTAVFNNNAIIEWKKFTTLEGNQKQHEIKDLELNSTDEIICINATYKSRKGHNEVRNNKGEIIAGYELKFMKINEDKTQPEYLPLELDQIFVDQAFIKTLPAGNMIVFGLTSLEHKGNINGLFYYNYDKSGNLVSTDFKQFSFKELALLFQQNIDIDFGRDENIGLDKGYDLCYAAVKEDGTAILTLEQNKVTYYSNLTDVLTNKSRGVISQYLSNDILHVNIATNGEIDKINFIPKKQVESIYSNLVYINANSGMHSSTFLSHSLMNYNGSTFTIYNDHKDNFRNTDPKKVRDVKKYKNMQSVIAHQEDEELIKSYFFDNNDADLIISPNKTKQISPNELFFSTMDRLNGKKRNLRIGLMTFNDF